MIKSYILADDRVRKRGLTAEHGLCVYIEFNNKKILFDTGQSLVFVKNVEKMGIDIMDTDYIILSHGHYDHCGGLGCYPVTEKMPKVYAHPDIFLNKYILSEKTGINYMESGIPWQIEKVRWLSENINYTRNPLTIDKGITVTGEIPKKSPYENIPENFYIKKDGKIIRDIMIDEQVLILEDDDGIAIFLGCSHPGVVNCLKHAISLFPGKKIKLLIGGMHLESAGRKELLKTIEYMKSVKINKVIPLHCSGFNAQCEMKRILKDNCSIKCAGDIITC